MSLHVSVDFGTSSTCAVVSVGGGEPQVVVIDGQPLVPSAVFAAPDGTLFVGQEAERQAAVDPSRFEPHPKRRIDEGELLLGSSVLRVTDVVRAVLRRVVGEARRYAGGAAVDLLVLTHPAEWGAVRTQQLRQAAAGLARELAMVPEPVAAAVFHSAGHGLPDGGALAVLDLGGGTVDASAVSKHGPSFRVLATRGDPNFGGADVDQALLDHVGGIVSGTDEQAWQQLVEGRDMVERRRRRVLRQDIRGAKETLSRHTYTDVPMPPPFSDAHVTRTDLERLVAEPLAKAVELVLTTLREGNVPRQQLAGVFLVGGSSRIPMVARLVHERVGIVPTTLDQPETVVARGALRAVLQDPDRTGGLAVPGGQRAAAAPTVRRYPASGPPGVPAQAPLPASHHDPVPHHDSLSRASTIVIGGSDPTRQVATGPERKPCRSRKPWYVGGGAVAVVGAGAVIALLLTGGGQPQELARYRYSLEHPSDWEPTREDPRRWQTVLEPEEGELDGLIAVEQGDLGYNAEAPGNPAVAELRQHYVTKINAGERFSGFDESRNFAGREVVFYREELPAADVEWYVIHEKQYRVSVGCQYGSSGADEVRKACEQVVRSLVVG